MEDHLNIVLYSKFSGSCAKFMEMIEKVPTFKHTTICIDNAEVRKRILTSKKLTIKQVPSIIRLYQKNGYAESFEGERAFSLLNAHYIDYLQEMTKEMAKEKEMVMTKEKSYDDSTLQMSQIPQMSQMSQMTPSNQPTNISSQLPTPPPPPNDPSGMSTTNMRSVLSTSVASNGPNTNSTGGGQTSLENLMDLSDLGDNQNENALNTYHHVAPASNVSISGNIKKDGGSAANIVSRAMQMQKERENETSTTAKIPQI